VPCRAIPHPLPGPPCSYVEAARSVPRRLRIAVSDAFPRGTLGRLAPDIRRALDTTAEALRGLGHEVVERDVAFEAGDVPVVLGLMFRGIRDLVREVERPQRLERRTRAIARPGALVSDRMLAGLERRERVLAGRLQQVFADHDALLTPMMSRPPVRAGLMEGRGATVTYLWESGWVPFSVLWNMTGQPAASVPAGFTDDGLPLAVQLVARPQDETTLLSLAAQLESARPWTSRRPPWGGDADGAGPGHHRLLGGDRSAAREAGVHESRGGPSEERRSADRARDDTADRREDAERDGSRTVGAPARGDGTDSEDDGQPGPEHRASDGGEAGEDPCRPAHIAGIRHDTAEDDAGDDGDGHQRHDVRSDAAAVAGAGEVGQGEGAGRDGDARRAGEALGAEGLSGGDGGHGRDARSGRPVPHRPTGRSMSHPLD
jgi:hypothetical protein